MVVDSESLLKDDMPIAEELQPILKELHVKVPRGSNFKEFQVLTSPIQGYSLFY